MRLSEVYSGKVDSCVDAIGHLGHYCSSSLLVTTPSRLIRQSPLSPSLLQQGIF